MSDAVHDIAIELLERDWNHPRHDLGGFKENALIESVRRHGILTAVAVMERGDGRYLVIDGQRRVYVAWKLGFPTVPCVVHPKMNEGELQALR